MKKPTLAVLFGGCSPEYSVSLQSSYAVLSNLNPDRYTVLPVGITQSGQWFHYTGAYDRIATDTWAEDPGCLTPVVVSQDRSVHGLLAFSAPRHQVIQVDYALPILHGKNGEDGTVQGLLELAGIPVVGCGTLASALCMDKDRAHKLASLAGVAVPASLVLKLGEDPQAAVDFARQTGLSPLCEARESGLFLRHLPDSPRGRASSRPGPGVSVRQSGDFRGDHPRL